MVNDIRSMKQRLMARKPLEYILQTEVHRVLCVTYLDPRASQSEESGVLSRQLELFDLIMVNSFTTRLKCSGESERQRSVDAVTNAV